VTVPCDREFTLKVEHAGYKTFERRFTAATGVPLRIDAALPRQDPVVAKKSRLRIATEPAGAIVTVDGKVVGRGPAAVTVGIGDTVFVTATLKGHKGWSKKVYVKKKAQTVSAKLEAIE
jgi:plastocyanin